MPKLAMTLPPGFLSFLVFGLLILSTAGFAVSRWLRWGRNARERVEPNWRGALALFGFAASTLSLVAAVVLWIHALLTGGFPFYHPILLFVPRAGFWTALFGFVSGVVGKGQLRLPAIFCSIVCFAVWLSEAMAQ